MTQEEKELLLKDLCGRLSYGILVKHQQEIYPVYLTAISKVGFESRCRVMPTLKESFVVDAAPLIEDIKPYLRPMSSMTEEEREEYKKLCIGKTVNLLTWSKTTWYDTWKSFDWLNAHHFDYRGLIEKGLALEAPDEMYKI